MGKVGGVPIPYDRVIDSEGRQIFGGVPTEVYEWCFNKENRWKPFKVLEFSSTTEVTIHFYLFGT